MINHFDTVAQTWDNNPINLLRTKAISEEIKNLIFEKNYSTALEFGAGTGLLSVALKDYFSEITLMDSSIKMIEVTNAKLLEAKINHLKPVFYDLEKNIYNEKTFDVIFSQMALHHVVDIDIIISKFYKLLNKNGIIAIADLYQEDGTFHDQTFTGHFGFNPDDLSKILSKSRFKQVEYKQCFEIEREKENKTIKKYPFFLITGLK